MFMPKKAATSWLSVLVLLFSFVVPILGTAPAANAATLAMEFDPGSSASNPGSNTVLKDSITGAEGTMNGVTYSNSTNCGVLNFNGSSNITFGQRDFGNTFSYSTWYKTSSLGNTIQTFMSNAGPNLETNGFKLEFNSWQTNDGKLLFESGNGSSGGATATASGSQLTPDTWHHLVFTFNKGTNAVTIYKDKNLVHTGTSTSNFGTNNSNWYMGAIGGWSYYLNGYIGVTKIYSTVLTSSEVTADYDSTSARYTSTPTCPTRTLTAPTSVSVSAATQSLNVSWSAPAETNGAVISGYQVEYSTSGTGSWTTASSSIANNATSYTITGLTGGTQYYVRVAAKYGSNLGAYGYPWTKIYSVTNAARSSGLIQYETGFGLGAGNASNTYANSSFTRIRYKMAATYSSNNYYVDADFSKTLGTTSSYSETFDAMEKLQVPTISGSGSQFEIQGNVSDLNVQSNNPNVVDGSGLNGRLEIWPWNYDVSAQAGLSGRAGTTYDDSDTATLNATYGSFQLHTLSGTAATIFAWNNHSATPEIGFGNYTGTHSDWTFCSTDSGPGCANRTNFSLIIYVNIPTAPTALKSITYALNSGSGSAPTQADTAQGNTFSVASATGINRSGYTFTGWSDGSTVYQPSATYTVGSSNVTLTAQWASNDPTTTTFNYTGSAQTWTVPSGVTSVSVSVKGGSGGVSNGGFGAIVTGTLSVTPGNVLQVNVGGRGASGSVSNAFGGGGMAGSAHASVGGGGGASDIRNGAYGVANRIVVAGGGGGGGGAGAGGNGGTPNGVTGTRNDGTFNGYGGGGGTSSAGGAAGANMSQCWDNRVALAQAGSLGQGGTGAGGGSSPYTMGAGGGGGYYGGGGGGAGCNYGSGGGGSSWVNSSLVTSETYTVASTLSDGSISFTYGGYAPTLTGATISGTVTQGQTLTAAVQGAGGGTATSTTYQWSKADTSGGTYANISGATGSTFVITGNEVGKFIKVTITVSNSVGSNSATSSATSSVALIAPTIASASISGTLSVGNVLTAVTGTLGGGAVASTTYQWKSAGTSTGTYTNISGATSSTYTLTTAEGGKFIKVTITVTNAVNSASATSAATATAIASITPTVSSISPNAGTTAGGTTVTISGTNFASVSSVTFDGSAATITSKTATQLKVTTPAHAAGAVDIVITNTNGSVTSTNGFTYATAPTVSSWTTAASITSGSLGASLTVTYTAVCTTPQTYGPGMFDNLYITAGSWIYNTYIGSGTSTDGGYTWTVSKTYTLNSTGIWTIDAYQRGACWGYSNFIYATPKYVNIGVPGPTITSLNTTSGPTAGGTATTITGTNLSNVTGITVGGVAATSIRSNTATSVTFNTPAGTAGAKDVVVTNNAGSATSTGGFTYTAPITVTYDVNTADSGTPSRSSDSYSPNTGGFSLPTVGTMVKTGYTFGGWATANNSSTPIASPYNPQSTLTVYAIWTVKSYSTTYNVNGASSGTAPSVSNNNFGATVTVAGNSGSLARTGYTLAGWNTQADGLGTDYILGTGTYVQGAANLILYADWVINTYTVAYDVNGSSDAAPATHSGVVSNGSVTLAAGVTKASYAFVGWEENSITYAAGSTFNVGTANKTMVAKWIAVYTLSYNLNGSGATGSIPADHLYTSGDPVIVDSVVPVRSGYTFGGWIDQSGGSHASGSTYNIASTNYLLYAVWTPINYTVTYALNGGSGTAPTESSKNYLASFAVAAAPSRSGYTFNGWSDGSVVYGAGSTYSMPASNKTFTAQWSANTYLITYDLAQGTSTVPSAVSKAFAASWALPDTPTRVGYNFLDWYDGTTGYAAQANYTMATASNLTISARWAAIVYYTVTYDLNGGLGTASQDPLQNGQSFTLPADPTKTGYSFTGWSYASNSYISGSSITMPASNVTITATWTATSSGTYAVTYIGNGSQTAVPTLPALAAGATFIVDDGSGLIKNGYIFSGWSYNGNTYTGGETVTMPSSAANLSALWVPTIRATAVSQSVDSTSVTRGRSLTVTYSLGCYNSSSTPTITENVSTTGESFINDISAQLTVVDAGYNWTVTRVYTLSYVGTYTVFATASGGCFSAATDSASSTVTVTEAPSNSGGSSNSNANSSGGSGSGAPTSIPPVTVVGARMALVANKYYTLPKIASNATVSVEAKAGATNSVTSTIKEGTSTVTSTTMLNVNSVTKGLSEVKIVENQLAVVPSQGFSGNATISVTVTDGATTSTVQIPVTVLPEPVKDPSITPVSARSTVVTWDASPNATNYQVFVDGKSACKTVGESCTINKILGPNANVDVVANGGDATKSEVVDADYQAKSNVTIAKISGTFGKSTLSKNDITNLNKVIATVEKQGFENIQITGITTTKLTATAAKSRLDAMVEYIKSKVDNPDLVVKVVAPTTRTFTNQIAVK